MANKKINELDTRVGLADSDLIAVGDPSTGTLYKIPASDLLTIIGTTVTITTEEIAYIADGSEGSSVTIPELISATIIGIYRSTRLQKVLTSPLSNQVRFTSTTGKLEFSAYEPLVAGEKIIVDKISI